MRDDAGYDEITLPLGKRREPFLKLALASLAGPLCWALHFALVYLLEGLFCRQESPPAQLITGAIIVATLAFGGVCLWLMIRSRDWLYRAGGGRILELEFLVHLTRTLAGLALLATVWAGTGSVFLSPCSAVY